MRFNDKFFVVGKKVYTIELTESENEFYLQMKEEKDIVFTYSYVKKLETSKLVVVSKAEKDIIRFMSLTGINDIESFGRFIDTNNVSSLLYSYHNSPRNESVIVSIDYIVEGKNITHFINIMRSDRLKVYVSITNSKESLRLLKETFRLPVIGDYYDKIIKEIEELCKKNSDKDHIATSFEKPI